MLRTHTQRADKYIRLFSHIEVQISLLQSARKQHKFQFCICMKVNVLICSHMLRVVLALIFVLIFFFRFFESIKGFDT